jgi:hypothetical protein
VEQAKKEIIRQTVEMVAREQNAWSCWSCPSSVRRTCQSNGRIPGNQKLSDCLDRVAEFIYQKMGG